MLVTKKNFRLIGLGVLAIVVITLIFNVVKNVDKSEIVCCQHITGKLVFWTTPGPKFQLFGKTTSYDKSVQVWFSQDQKGGKTINGPINIRFNDGGTARISGSVRVELPTNEEQLYKIVTKFSDMNKLMSDLIIPTVNKSVQASGPMMTAYESYAEKKNDLMRYIEDQISNGVYQTVIKEVRVQDEISGDEKVVRIAFPVQDSKAINGIKRQELPPFKEFGIKIVQVALNDIQYDEVVLAQISKQQQILMDMKTSYSAALKAKQDAIKAEEMGKAKAAEKRWEQEAIKAVEVTKAQQAYEVAALQAKEAKEVAKKIIAEGEAQAAANRAKVNAGLTPQEAAEWEYKKTVGVAAELAKSNVKWVPEIMIIGDKQTGANPLDAVGLKMLLDVTKTLNSKLKMNWENVYQLPLKYNEDCSFWVDSSNGVHAIDILMDCDHKYLVKILNGEEKFYKAHDFCISDDTILCDNKPLLRVRGWGHLTGVGALNLSVLEAIKIQNDFLNYLLDVLKKS